MQAAARRTLGRLAAAGVTLICGVATSGCRDVPSPPERLADGTRARIAKLELEGVDVPVISTRTTAARRQEPPAMCADARWAIDRVGVHGASRTALSDDGRELRACDWTPRSGWCGVGFAHVRADRPLDPRLSLTCRDAHGDALGFLWIYPVRGTAVVVVAGEGYAESYPVVGGAPVRVTGESVDPATSSATVVVSEHAQDGSLLRIRRIEAQVSG